MSLTKYLNPLQPYMSAIKWGGIVLVLFSIGFAGMKVGGNRVQAKWDADKVVVQERQIQLQTRVIDLQTRMADRDRAQATKDAAAAAAGAEERDRLEAQSKQVQSTLAKLTRDLAKSPQYSACKMDDAALQALNRSLK